MALVFPLTAYPICQIHYNKKVKRKRERLCSVYLCFLSHTPSSTGRYYSIDYRLVYRLMNLLKFSQKKPIIKTLALFSEEGL